MFFKTQDSIPEGLGFKAFDLTHLLWLVAIIAACVLLCKICRGLNEKSQNTIFKTVGIAVIAQEMLKNIVVAIVVTPTPM